VVVPGSLSWWQRPRRNALGSTSCWREPIQPKQVPSQGCCLPTSPAHGSTVKELHKLQNPLATTHTMEAEGWESIAEELLLKVLEDGLGWARETSCALRLVSRWWKIIHDGGCKAVRASLDVQGPFGPHSSLTDEALAMMCKRLPAITSLDISYCDTVTDEGLAAAVSSLPALTCLNLRSCYKVTDAGLRAVSSLHELTSLNLSYCRTVTDDALLIVSSLPALASLSVSHCYKVTDEGLRAVSKLHALTSLNINCCVKVTDAGVRAVSSRRGTPP
jgi:hypothetical protein